MKLDQQEINELKFIKDVTDKAIVKLGEIQLQRVLLGYQEEKISAEVKEATNKRDELSAKLFEKYGKINVNLETGEYTLLEE